MSPLLDQKLISTKEASEKSGYNQDYLSRLCKSGKIKASQFGRVWLVNESSLMQFMRSQEKQKAEAARKLSKDREREYQRIQQSKILATQVAQPKNVAVPSPFVPTQEKITSQKSPISSILLKPRIAVAVALMVVAGSAYASVPNAMPSFASAASGKVVAFARVHAFSYRPDPAPAYASIPVPGAHVAHAADQIPQAVTPQGLSARFAFMSGVRTNPYATYSTGNGHSGSENNNERATVAVASVPPLSSLRFFASSASIATIGDTLIRGYVDTGTLTLAAINGILDGYESGVKASGEATYDSTSKLATYSNDVTNGYVVTIYGWVNGSQQASVAIAQKEIALGTFIEHKGIDASVVALASEPSHSASIGTLPAPRDQYSASAINAVGSSIVTAWDALGTTLYGGLEVMAGLFDPSPLAIQASTNAPRVQSMTFASSTQATSDTSSPSTTVAYHASSSVTPATTTYVSYVTNTYYPTTYASTGTYTGSANGAVSQGEFQNGLADVRDFVRQSVDAVAGSVSRSSTNESSGSSGSSVSTNTGNATFDNATITNAVITNATTTNLVTSNLNLGGSIFTSLLGTGLQNIGGVLSVSTSSFGTPGSGTVTSVNASGGSTGLSFTGGPVTASGTLTLGGMLGVPNGGTGTTTLTGLLKGNGTAAFSTAVAGTDYQAPIILTTTGTTGAATFVGNTLNIPQYSGTAYTAGTGLSLIGTSFANTGVLSFNGRAGAVTPTSGDYTTSLVPEGSNLYFTNARADARVQAATTLPNLTSATSLGTVATTLTGIVRAASGVLSTGAINLGSSDVTGTVAVGNGGTGLATAPTLNQILLGNGSGGYNLVATSSLGFGSGNGSVTSVNASGGTTGLTFTGGPITNAGTLTLGGTLAVANGGSGATSLTGILKGNGTSAFSAAVAGTDYQAPLTFTYPLINSGNVISTGFSTSTANTFSQPQTFNAGASTTALRVSGSTTLNTLSLGSLTGFLKASAGTVATSLIDLSADVTNTLPTANGGTGQNTFNTGDLLYGNSGGSLSVLPIGATGKVLKVIGGIPAWSDDLVGSGGGGSDGIFATSTGVIYPIDPASTVIIGDNTASSPSSIFETHGSAYISGNLGIGTTTPSAKLAVTGGGTTTGRGFTVTNSSNLPNFTVFDNGNASLRGTLTLDSLSGILRATAGLISTTSINLGSSDVTGTVAVGNGGTGLATAPTLNQILLGNGSGGYNLVATSSLGFGSGNGSVTSVNASGGTTGLTFTGGPITNAGTLTLGGTLAVANGGTGSGSLTGLLKGNGTAAFSAAVAGTDYQAPITLTTTGTSGAATFNTGTGVLNVPQYSGTTYTAGTGLTLSGGNAFSVNTSQNINTLSNLTTNGLVKTSGGTGALSVAVAGTDYQAPGNYITALTGDAAATGPGSATLTLATVNSNVGTFNNVTVNGKGLVTAASNVAYLTNAITGIGPAGQTQTGPTITQATTTSTTNGLTSALTITGSGNVITYTPSLSGTLAVAGGGSGATSLTGLLKGNGTSAFSAAVAGTDYQAPIILTTTGTTGAATFVGNTLNIPQYTGTIYTAGTGLSLTGTTFANTGVLSFNGRAGAVTPTSGDYTTSLVPEGSNLYFTNARADARVQAATTLPNLTSATSLGTVATTLTGIVRAASGVLSTGAINLGSSDVTGTVAVGNGGTGLATAPTLNQILLGNGSGGYNLVATSSLGFGSGNGSVTSVNASGGTTGLTFTGGPITNAGTLTLAGTLAVANGGTGSGSLTGLLKGNGTAAFSAAVAGTDYQAPGNYITALTGDAAATGPGSATLTLATVNSNVGTFNNVTVNGKGLVTAASNVAYLTGNQTITLTGDVSGTGTTNIVTTLPTVNANVGTFNNVTVNGKGLVTAASNVAYLTNAITGIGPAGQTQTGPTITQATTTSTTNGLTSALTITGSGNVITYTPSLSGTLAVAGGGSGATSLTGLLKGNGTSAFSAAVAGTDYQAPIILTTTGTTGAATFVGNTLNIPQYTGTIYTAGTGLSLTGTTFANTGVLSFNGRAGAVTPTSGDYTTALVTEDPSNLYFTNARADARVQAATTLPNLTSATSLGTVATTLTGIVRAASGVLSTGAINLGSSDVTGTVAVGNGGTGLATAPSLNQILLGNGSGGYALVSTSSLGFGTGTVTSVQASGGATGLTFSGGPITNAGTLTLAGTLGAANGGSGATSLTGLLKGNGTSPFTAAIAGTDYQVPGNYITALTGDGTAGGPGSAVLTLATVNSNIGTFNNVTVNGKGLVTGASNVAYLTNALTGIGPAGQTQNGPIITQATTTTPFNGLTSALTITGSGNVLTYAPSLSGTLGVGGGGSGAISLTGLLKGNGTSAFSAAVAGTDYLSPSSLSAGSGISYNSGTGVIANTGVLSFNGRIGAVVPTGGDYTTTLVPEGTNLYFTNARADARVQAATALPNLTSATSLGTVSTTLTGILRAASGVLSTGAVNLNSADITGSLAILNGGTNATGQTTNGVNYFDGTRITSGTALTFAGGNLGVGTGASDALVTISTSTAFAAPRAGTMLHIVGESSANPRVELDYYNSINTGPIYQGRHARGTAAAPSASLTDDVLAAFGGDSYGTTGFHTVSPGSLTIRAEATTTDTSAPTYLTFSTAPVGSVTGAERLRITSAGFVGIATSTPGSLFSIGGIANFSTATTTFYSAGGINLTSGCFAVNGTCIGASAGGGITGFGPAGQIQSGPTITQATTTSTTNGLTSALTITGSGNTLTYAPSLSGVLTLAGGGTNNNGASLTTNGVEYYDGSSITNGSGLVFSGGQLGIGTTTPSQALTVAGGALITGNTSLLGQLSTLGTATIKVQDPQAFAVGRLGATNPAFNVDSSATNSATGINIISSSTGNGVSLVALDSGLNTGLTIDAKGTSALTLGSANESSVYLGGNNSNLTQIGAGTSGTIRFNFNAAIDSFSKTAKLFNDGANSSATTSRFSFTGYGSGSLGDTNLAANTEAADVYFNLGQPRGHIAGTIPLQRDFRITGSLHSFAGASTITNAAAFSVDGPDIAATSSTITNSSAIYVPSTNIAFVGTTTNAYGLNINASTGATNNYAATFLGGNVGIGTSTPTAQLSTTGSVRFSNFGAGTLQTDALGNVTVSSDERLKNINGNYTRGLDDLAKLSPILYHWNAISGLDQVTQYAGFSAQNVQSAIPEAVNTDSRGYLTLQDRPILAAAVNAINQLAGTSNALSTTTNSLSNRLTLVEQKNASPLVIPQTLSASTISAQTLSLAGLLTAVSAQVGGDVQGARFIVPASAASGISTNPTVPAEVLTTGGDVDITKMGSYTLGLAQALSTQTSLLSNKIDTLDARVAALENLNLQAASSTPGMSGTSLQSAFSSFGAMIENGFAQFTSLAFNQLTVKKTAAGGSAAGSAVVPAGATTITVNNSVASPTSKIFITLTSASNGTWYVANKQQGSFTVNWSVPQQGTSFDYFIVGTDGDSSEQQPVPQPPASEQGAAPVILVPAPADTNASSSTQSIAPVDTAASTSPAPPPTPPTAAAPDTTIQSGSANSPTTVGNTSQSIASTTPSEPETSSSIINSNADATSQTSGSAQVPQASTTP